MKSMLVLIGGSDRDEVVFQTALAAALPFSAHMNFLHIRVGSGEASRYTHVEYARGHKRLDALEQLEGKASTFSQLAADHVRDLCARASIEMRDTPTDAGNVTASFREEADNALERLIFHARHCDLVVMGRAKQAQGLPQTALERLVMNCGRPMLVVATAAPQQLTGTIMVCWKESDNAARAVAAATPLLAKAKRVVFTSVVERDESVAAAVNDLAQKFAWNGVATEVRVIPAQGRKIPGLLASTAEECGADLVVMGAYGRSRARELLFGSCTEAFIGHADKPILLMH